MAAIETGSNSTGIANVDSNFNLNVVTPTAMTQAGFVVLAGRNDDGTVVAGGRTNRVYVTEGNRLAIAPGNLLWDDTFNAAAQNTSKYKTNATTQTVTYVNGYAILNGSNITTINTNSILQSYKTFPLFAKAELRCNFSAMMTTAPQTNSTTEFGLFSFASNTVAPSDGVFFRYNSSAELRGVISYNGTETQTTAMTPPSANVNHDFVIVCQTNTVLFYIDDILYGKITLSTDAPGQGQPMMAAALPISARHIIGGSAPSSATQLKISDIFVTLNGPDICRPWSEAKAGFGHMGYQGQNGGTLGTTALYTNSLAAGAGAAMTNTTAALGSGLGGQFACQPTLAAGTDGIVCSYQNASGSTTQTPRNLIIKGVKIAGGVTTTLTGGPVLYAYSLAFGHTAVSMATAEAATTKAPRRIALGYETFAATAAAGVISSAPSFQFTSPIVVAPGEFVAVCAKNLGTVTSAGVITLLVTFDAYWE
jgi:hypothetical protein